MFHALILFSFFFFRVSSYLHTWVGATLYPYHHFPNFPIIEPDMHVKTAFSFPSAREKEELGEKSKNEEFSCERNADA
ncbi:hypothetical protein V8C26DRAFT_385141 [Trichoderma gracile]